MANRFILEGFSDLLAGLRQLPELLTEEATEIVDHTAEITASSLRQVYPLGETGKLRAGVKIKATRSRFGAARIVRSTSPHAHLWEFGTQNRHTRAGWFRGRAPSHSTEGLVAIATRNRRRMNLQLIDLVRREGFEVTGAV
jgi:hypothetical protein